MSRLTSHSFRSIVLAAAAVAGLSAAPRPADAQLMGRLKNRIDNHHFGVVEIARARRAIDRYEPSRRDRLQPVVGAFGNTFGYPDAKDSTRAIHRITPQRLTISLQTFSRGLEILALP